MKALKKTRLQLIHQGTPLFNRTFMRSGQMLPQLPENYSTDGLHLITCLSLNGSELQILCSHSLPGPRWSLVDLVLSFFRYSPYHSSGCTHSTPSAASSLNYQPCLLSLQALIKHKLQQSHCKPQVIPKKSLLFSNLPPVRSNTFAGSLFYSCATVLQTLPTEEIRWLRQPSLPVILRFRPTWRLHVLSYCFMQNT